MRLGTFCSLRRVCIRLTLLKASSLIPAQCRVDPSAQMRIYILSRVYYTVRRSTSSSECLYDFSQALTRGNPFERTEGLARTGEAASSGRP